MSFIRKMAVRAIAEKDYSPKTIAEVFGISLSSIYDGLERYRKGGYAMLGTLTSPGAPRVITAEMDEWLQDTVINGKPMDFGYDTVRWTRALLAELLNKEFGIAVAGSTVSLHVQHLDLSYRFSN